MSLNFIRLYYRPRVADRRRLTLTMMPGCLEDEVPKKLKQNINTVHILTLMVAFHDGTIHDVATKVGDYNKTGGVPRPQLQAVTEHMMQLGEQMSTGNL